MSNNKIAIVITTFLRDELLYTCIDSLMPFLSVRFELIIVDQNPDDEKRDLFKSFHYISVPYDSGLSYSRNIGVEKAKELGCEFTIIGSDSFLFNDSFYGLDRNFKLKYDLLGFELSGCVCDWEAYLTLIPGKSFNLTFIDKPANKSIFACDIVRNFFIARTRTLIESPWNNNLKLCEHESFFYEYKQKGFTVGWTNLINATKMPTRPDEYAYIREKNFRDGQVLLKEIYNIKEWVSYSNEPTGKK